jgi:hypothetical protein
MPERFQFPRSVVTEHADQVTTRVSEALGVRGDELDASMKAEIESAVSSTLERRFISEVTSAAESGIGQAAARNVDVAGAITAKVGVGARAITAVLAAAEFDDILAKNATLMKKKFDALVTAGFTEDQAFRLIEAEVYSKGAGRPR